MDPGLTLSSKPSSRRVSGPIEFRGVGDVRPISKQSSHKAIALMPWSLCLILLCFCGWGGSFAHAQTDSLGGQVESEIRSSENALARLRKPLSTICLADDEPAGRVPENLAAEAMRQDSPGIIRVTSTGVGVPLPNRYTECFRYRPLYFEQPNLERCGRSCGYFQNAISGFRFLSNTMTLPYHMAKQRPDCPTECGSDCQTCQTYPSDWNPFPLDPHATIAEMATIGGISLLFL